MNNDRSDAELDRDGFNWWPQMVGTVLEKRDA
jgi:hypothetical protein